MAAEDAGARRVGGRYALVRQVGSGGMGTVWLARDETLRRNVAVKMLRLQPFVTEPERADAVDRAMREARLAARLHHPNAVQVYDIVDDPESGPCLILQYVPSRSLADVVSEDGPLAPHETARIGTQLAAALAAAHRVGVVHRDIKPGNVLMADDGTVKITDFGVSHAFDDVTVTATGLVTGTPAYLAPESARGEESTEASDVYSLGATLYFAVEGRSPVGDDGNQMAVLHRVASGQHEPPRQAGALTSLLESTMAANPAARPTMVTLASRLPDLHPLTADGAAPEVAVTQQLRALPAAGQTMPVAAARPPAPPRAPSRPAPPVPVIPVGPPPPGKRGGPNRAWLAIAAAVVVVVIGVVLAVVLLRNAADGNTTANGAAALREPTGRIASSPTAAAPTSEPAVPAPPTTAPPSPPSPTSTPTPTTPSATPTPTPTPTPSHTRAAAPSADELTSAVVEYFRLIPGDLDAGWNRLTPSFQEGRAGGRASYDDYWRTVDRVDVDNPRGDSPRTVHARLVYRYKDGSVVRQSTKFRLVRQDGVLKIDGQS